MKSFLGNFYRHLAIFFWSHWWEVTKRSLLTPESCSSHPSHRKIFFWLSTALKTRKRGQELSIRERTEKKIQKQNYFIIIVHEQCEQVGRFLKVVWTTLVTKIDKIFSDTLGHFEKLHCWGYFWATFRENWPTFYSNIWSHCPWVKERRIPWCKNLHGIAIS